MLLDGFDHVAILTSDTERFVTFYRDVFDAEVKGEMRMGDEGVLTFVGIGADREINLFEVAGNTEPQRQTPMFGRGRIDHLGPAPGEHNREIFVDRLGHSDEELVHWRREGAI